MPRGRLHGEDLPTASEPRSRELGGAGSSRPRARGVDSGRLSSPQRPALLGRGEAYADRDIGPEETGQGSRAGAQRLKATILISEVLSHYDHQQHGFRASWQSVRCPFHADSHASASYNDAIGRFFCHACDINGDIFDIVQSQEGIGFPEAVAFIEGNLT